MKAAGSDGETALYKREEWEREGGGGGRARTRAGPIFFFSLRASLFSILFSLFVFLAPLCSPLKHADLMRCNCARARCGDCGGGSQVNCVMSRR